MREEEEGQPKATRSGGERVVRTGLYILLASSPPPLWRCAHRYCDCVGECRTGLPLTLLRFRLTHTHSSSYSNDTIKRDSQRQKTKAELLRPAALFPNSVTIPRQTGHIQVKSLPTSDILLSRSSSHSSPASPRGIATRCRGYRTPASTSCSAPIRQDGRT